MKLKVFLITIIALLSFQLMNAIPITIGNAWSQPIKVTVEKIRNVGRDIEWGILNPRESIDCNLEDNDIIYMGTTVYRGYDACKWGIVVKDLEAAHIPLTGDHEITIFMNNDLKTWGVMVDENDVIFINAHLMSLYRPKAIAAAAA